MPFVFINHYLNNCFKHGYILRRVSDYDKTKRKTIFISFIILRLDRDISLTSVSNCDKNSNFFPLLRNLFEIKF